MRTPPRTTKGSLLERQKLLLAANLRCLRQAEGLLDQLGDAAYVDAAIGGQVRHILEFYECFLEGVAGGHIDYDARRRDPSLEANRRAALARISSLIMRLDTEPLLLTDCVLWVRMEDAPVIAEPFLTSSIGRELQTLNSHTVHHFAVIALTLRLRGYTVDREFGVAPSTLRHRAAKTAEAA